MSRQPCPDEQGCGLPLLLGHPRGTERKVSPYPTSVAAAARWPEGLSIRALRPDDVEELVALQSLPGYRYGTLRTPYPSALTVRKHMESASPSAISLVATMDGIMVGNAGMNQLAGRRSHADSIGMGVHDLYLRRGIGRALLGELVAIADEWLDVHRLELTVYTDNVAAIALYESFGFVQEGIHRDFAYRAGSYVDALAMARLRQP